MYELLRENLWVGMLLILLVSAIFAFVVIPKTKAANKRRQKIRERDAAVEAEAERIAKLPKLYTRWLLLMPEKNAAALYGADRSGLTRTFGNRYNRLIIIDEDGNCWVGLFNRQTLQSLRDSEFEQRDYWVPFRGPGEMYAGSPVTVEPDNLLVDIYPLWMSPNGQGQDWAKWAELERKFDEEFLQAHYHDVFEEILSMQYRLGVKKQRDWYAQLLKQPQTT